MTYSTSIKEKIETTYPENHKDIFHKFVLDSQKRICDLIEKLDAEASDFANFKPQLFKERKWNYTQNGGGQSMVMREGRLFEKAGVNVSRVSGEFSKELSANIPGTENNQNFEAMGISLVIHPRNPHVPITHLNTRHITTKKSWFGGGADLTPAIPNDEDTAYFHQCFKESYDSIDKTYYPKFKTWADEYYYLPHRKESRGVGGTFYDYVETNFEKDLALAKATVDAFCKSYAQIVRKHMHTTWSDEDMKTLLKKRGRYVEFNLIHDRGTIFGFKTGGDTEAILVSMPPLAAW